MTRAPTTAVLTLGFLVISAHLLRADVRADEKRLVKFEGMLGRMVNLFGGKAAREGTASTVAVKGDRKASINENSGQIIDLAEEKIYDLDMRRKTYKVTTFAELRQRMEQARRKAEENAQKESAKPEARRDEKKQEVEIDFSIKETGQKKSINGYDTHEVVMTIAVREKGKTLEQGGGLVLTSDLWLAPPIPAMREIAEFDMRYTRKLAGTMVSGASPDEMAAALAMYPMMKDAIGKMSAENVNMDGTPMMTTVTIDAVKSPEQMAQEQKSSQEDDKGAAPAGVGGLLGGFAKKMAKKKSEGEGGEAKARATFMTTTHEVLKVSSEVSGADVAVPAGFKEGR